MNVIKQLVTKDKTERQSKGFAVLYLGLSYATQPTPEELRRIVNVLFAKNNNRQGAPARLQPNLDRVTITRDEDSSVLRELRMDKIVFCCVDAKNQKTFAIFYHNNDYMEDYTRGLECHLVQGRSKEVTRKLATLLGDLLMESFKERKEKEKEKKLKQTEPHGKLSYASYVQSATEGQAENAVTPNERESLDQPKKKVSPPKPPRASKRIKITTPTCEPHVQKANAENTNRQNCNVNNDSSLGTQELSSSHEESKKANDLDRTEVLFDSKSLENLADLMETDL